MPRDLEKSEEKAGVCFILPISAGNTSVNKNAKNKAAAITATAALKPMLVKSIPPRKNPTPLSAFLEPVRIATHLNNCFSP